MSLPIRYGRPKAAARKKKNGFLLGRGGLTGVPSGRNFFPSNFAKALGVKAVASAGGGRPVSLAKRVLIHRSIANMPRIDPSVFLRLPNCSATDTIATIVSNAMSVWKQGLTKEAGMSSHICALKHLRKASKGAHYALDYLESGLRALRKTLR